MPLPHNHETELQNQNSNNNIPRGSNGNYRIRRFEILRDFTLPNILIDDNYFPLIIDFGNPRNNQD